MSAIFTIKSNARRAARKAGVDPNEVYSVPEGWKFPDPESKAELGPVGPENKTMDEIAAEMGITRQPAAEATFEPIKSVGAISARCPKCMAVFGTCDHTKTVVAAPINTALALVANLDAKAIERVKAKSIKRPKMVKAAKPAKPAKTKPAAKVRGKRDGVCDRVIAAIHARWTSVDELLKLSGWQRHTLRGYISTRAAKDGFTVERRKVDGVPQYRVAA